jgi:hypothetical protein
MGEIRVLVCGSRDWADRDRLRATLDERFADATLVIHGGASGADSLAHEWARDRGISVQVYPADWQTCGRKAGPLRNRHMLERGGATHVIAFRARPDSRGTNNMIFLARKRGLPLWVVDGGES